MNKIELNAKESFISLLLGIKAAYPNHKVLEDKASIEMWYRLLKDIPYQQLAVAIQTHIATNKFPPSIAEIREASILRDKKDWGEGWGIVQYAIRRYGQYRETEALNYIRREDETAYQVIKRLNFKEVCNSENSMTDRANFRMMYENAEEINQHQSKLPQGLKDQRQELMNNQIMRLANRFSIEGE